MADDILVKFRTDLNEFKKQLDDVKGKMSSVKAEAEKVGGGISPIFTKIGTAITGAFAIHQVISFGKAAFRAFEEAELAARKLNVAVGVSGGTQAQFEKLLKQSAELQKRSIFSDDAIQQVQTMGLQFGLTADQVEKLLPLVSDFASATGQDLASAMQSVLVATNGQFRGLKQYGIVLKDAGSQSNNLANITAALTDKFKGQSELIANTASGRVAQMANEYNNLQESIGGVIALGLEPFFKGVSSRLSVMNATLTNETIPAWERWLSLISPTTGKELAELTDLQKFLKETNDLIKGRVVITEQARVSQIESINKSIASYEKEQAQYKKTSQEAIAYQIAINDLSTERKRLITLDVDAAAKADLLAKAKKDEILSVQDLEDQITALTAKIKESNAEDGTSIKLSLELLALKEKLKAALGEETDAMKKRKAEQEKLNKLMADTIQFELQGEEDLKKEADERMKFEGEKIQEAIDLRKTKTKQEIEAERILTEQLAEQEDLRLKKVEENAELQAKIKQRQQEALIEFGQTTIDFFVMQEQQITDAQLESLETQKKNKEISEEEYQKKRKEILTKQFETEKRAAIAKALIDGAAAIVASLKTDPTGSLAIADSIIIALQIAKIAAQPTPKFHKGQVDITGRKINSKGEFQATLLEHESVIAPAPTKKYHKELEAINNMKFEDLIYTKYIIPALQIQKQKYEKQQNAGFAGNVAKSMMLNAKLSDGNIVEMLKRLNASSKENARLITESFKSKRANYRGSV
jgi:hypothetical protein